MLAVRLISFTFSLPIVQWMRIKVTLTKFFLPKWNLLIIHFITSKWCTVYWNFEALLYVTLVEFFMKLKLHTQFLPQCCNTMIKTVNLTQWEICNVRSHLFCAINTIKSHYKILWKINTIVNVLSRNVAKCPMHQDSFFCNYMTSIQYQIR